MGKKELFTIGYAGKSIDQFLNCLKINGVDCIVDVRSLPYSAAFPEYNKDNISKTLKANGVRYLHFGEQFGAKRVENDAYSKGYDLDGKPYEQVSFSKVHMLDKFNEGFNRIIVGINKGYHICFMCSEKFPKNCHRFIMLSWAFPTDSFEFINIIDEKTNQNREQVLVELLLEKNSMFKKIKRQFPNIDNMCLLDGMSDNSFNNPAENFYRDLYFKIGTNSSTSSIYEFGNYLIGYKKGIEHDD